LNHASVAVMDIGTRQKGVSSINEVVVANRLATRRDESANLAARPLRACTLRPSTDPVNASSSGGAVSRCHR
jgi:hypothetical protein